MVVQLQMHFVGELSMITEHLSGSGYGLTT